MTILETYLTNWLADHDCDYEVRECDDEFFVCEGLSFISVATHAKFIDNYFLRFIAEHGCTMEFSNGFIPEFLHEVGHTETNADFDDADWDEYHEFVKSFDGLDMDNWDNQVRYMSHPIELAATEWAINYINEHPAEIIELAVGLNYIFEKERNAA